MNKDDFLLDFQTAPDPTIAIQPLNQPWCIIILYVESDVTAASYSGAPQHNTHTHTHTHGGENA